MKPLLFILSLLIFHFAFIGHCIYLSPDLLAKANQGKHRSDSND